MNPPESRTLEQALFERMGISVDDALSVGTDVLDEHVAAAAERGIDVDQRLAELLGLVVQLTQPDTLTAIKALVDHLPQLSRLASLADQLPDLLATVGDVLDDSQRRLESEGLDVERSLVNGIQAALWLGSQVEKEDLQRMGKLIQSDVLNPDAVAVVENAASSLRHVQEDLCQSGSTRRVGLFGLWQALRNPNVQRSLAFATRFGECFGKNLGAQQQPTPPTKDRNQP
jgi:uncharacterized protein YjgD (DUF1641 family)